ncbi:hypothetical protein N9D31_02590 [Oligoflexaceae bacterium]|nr:hypothetical protein [Oligoflexaceae bacterium]
MIRLMMTALLLVSNFATAQDLGDTDSIMGDKTSLDSSDEDRASGHRFKATAGANLLENKNVVGQDDGKTTIYTLNLNYSRLILGHLTEWDTVVSLEEAFSRTPAIDRMIKTTDSLNVTSIYKKFFEGMTWLGAFARVEAKTPLMDGYNEQSGDVVYRVARKDSVEDITSDRLKLNDGFKPLTTKESLGLIAKAMNTKAATLEFRSGLGAKQISGAGQLLIEDDDTTAEIEARELQNVSMVGFAAGFELTGAVSGFDYKLMAEALYPMSYSPKTDNDPEPSELISTEASLELSYNLNNWMSANYKIASTKDPLLTEKAQVTQNFLLALTYTMESTN